MNASGNTRSDMNGLESCLLLKRYSPEFNLANTYPCAPTMLIVSQLETALALNN